MKEDVFSTYKKFPNELEAVEFSELLKNENIEFVIENASIDFDPSFSNNSINNEYRLKLKKEDFEKADEIQIQISTNLIEDLDKDYYLFKFTDQELIEVITKNDEWSAFDYVLAQKILKDRGQEISSELLKNLRKQRIDDLAKPEESQKTWIIGGYLFGILGGFVGVFIGWHLLSHKKTLPNGDKVYSYSAKDRKHGNRIVIIGSIFILFWTTVRILYWK